MSRNDEESNEVAKNELTKDDLLKIESINEDVYTDEHKFK